MKFHNNGSIEEKLYFLDYTVNSPNKRLVIFITHNKSIFLANDSWYQAWLKKIKVFLQPKKKEKSILPSDFLLLWKQLNLFYL